MHNLLKRLSVGDVFRRLASRLCCTSVFSRVSDLFLPYGQVGVGINGGLETAIHLPRLLDKINIRIRACNAFNICNRDSFLCKVAQEFPEILAWVQTCYLQPSELCFGSFRICHHAVFNKVTPRPLVERSQTPPSKATGKGLVNCNIAIWF